MKQLLIAGFVRSGTTFLGNVINAQKGFEVNEGFIRTILKTARVMGIKSFETHLDEHQKNVFLASLKTEEQSLKKNLNLNRNFSNLNELYHQIMDGMCKKGNKVIGSKVTISADWLNNILNETDTYIIYIYRDCRDVLLSSKNMFPEYNLLRFLINWRDEIKEVLKIRHKRLLMVKFEDLIMDSDNTLEKMSQFLGVEVKRLNNLPKNELKRWMKFSSFNDINKLFDEKTCYRWKNKKESKEVKYCDILIPGLMGEIGYKPNDVKNYKLFYKIKAKKDYLKANIFFNRKLLDFGRKILLGI